MTELAIFLFPLKCSTADVPLSEKVLYVYFKLLEYEVASMNLNEQGIRDLISECELLYLLNGYYKWLPV